MHDCKGRELKVGDTVLVPCVVKQTVATEDFCNVTVETIAGMPPEHKSLTTVSALNTRQVIRANAGDDVFFTKVVESNGGTRIE